MPVVNRSADTGKMSKLQATGSVFVISILSSLTLAVAYYSVRAFDLAPKLAEDALAFVAVCAIALPLCYTLRRVHQSPRITVVAVVAAALLVLPPMLGLVQAALFTPLDTWPLMRVFFENSKDIANIALTVGILVFFVAFYLSMLETEKDKLLLEEQMNEVQQRDEAYRTLVEHTLQALVIWRDRKFLFVNSVFEQMSGYRADELLAMTAGQVRDLIHPDDRDLVWERGARRLAGGTEPARYEFRMICKDGSVKWLEVFTALTQFGGKPAIQQAAIDVTERRSAEEALRNSELKYRTMAESISDIVWTMNMEDRFTYVSPSVEHILGYTVEEARVTRPSNVLVPESQARLVKQIEAAIERASDGGDAWVTQSPQEYDHYHKEGHIVPCEITCILMQDERGKVIGVIGVTRDVTERKRIEESLRASEEKYRTMAESISDMVWMIDMEGRVTYCNRATEQILGYAPEELVGVDMRQILTEHAFDRARTAIRESLDLATRGASADDPPREYDYLHKDGTIVPCEVVSRLIFDETSAPVAVVSVSRDARERKRADAERRRLEARMQQAQKLESMGILAGGIAHDFNNILVGILGNADLALEELPVGSPPRAYLHQINLSAKRAADLARQMLAYSGKGRFVIEEIDLNDLVLEMVRLLEASLDKKVHLAFELGKDLPAIEGDATQLRQVFMNLTTNAAESITGPRGVVTIATWQEDLDPRTIQESHFEQEIDPGRYVCLEVRDTGCGMSPETLRRIFDPFFTTKFTGRGLGLSAVLGIVRGHRSAITVESVLDTGTTVRVYFPALDVPARAVPKAPLEDHRQTWRGSGKILVVDDEATVLVVAQRILEHLGFEVLLAENGKQAIQVFKENADEIQVVLLDLTMPHMGGEETFDALRRIRPDVPVVLSSGYPEERAKAGFRAEDLAGYVQKPYTISTLAGVIQARFS